MGIVNISVVSTLKMRLSKILGVVLYTRTKIEIHTNVEGLLPPHFGNVQIISQKTTPLLAFGVGIAAFPKDWRKGQFGDKSCW